MSKIESKPEPKPLIFSLPDERGQSYAYSDGKILNLFTIFPHRNKRDFILFVKKRKNKRYTWVGEFGTREDAEREAQTIELHQITYERARDRVLAD